MNRVLRPPARRRRRRGSAGKQFGHGTIRPSGANPIQPRFGNIKDFLRLYFPLGCEHVWNRG
jgi:hypothetical protein